MIYTNEMIKDINLKKEKRKKILNVIFFPISLLIIVFIINVFSQKFILKKANIDFFGMEPFIIMTGSMEPNLNVGDMIITKKVTSQNEIQVGDIITYRMENGRDTVTHRVVEIVEENNNILFKTKGDNNNAPDTNLVSFDKVVGKKVFLISGVGNKLAFVFSQTGIILISIILLIYYKFSNEATTRVIAREEARRLYNIPKYKKIV